MKLFPTPQDHPMFIAQQGRCFYCARPLFVVPPDKRHKRLPRNAATRDHLIPRAAGAGGRVVAKIVWSCHECNHAKGARFPTPQEAKRFVDICLRIGWAPHRLAVHFAALAEEAA